MKEQLTELLLNTKAVLDKYDVEFWLNHGTLLGAVRDNDFIPWERDIDLGTWSYNVSDETRQSIAADLRSKGYKVLLMPTHMNVRNNRVWLDIAFKRDKYEASGVYVPVNRIGRYLGYMRTIMMSPHHYDCDKRDSVSKHYVLVLANTMCSLVPDECRRVVAGALELLHKRVGYKVWMIPPEYFNKLVTIEFCGERFKIPANPEAYLLFRYGHSWRTPRRNWKTTDGGGVV